MFIRPQVGVLLWVWISVMNPHKAAYGFSYDYPLLDIIVGVTLISLAVNWKSLPKAKPNALVVMLVIYFIWTTLTTIFAVEPGQAFDKWLGFAKTMLLVAAILASMNNRTWTIALVWVLVLSLGLTGVKGGFFTLVTGGGARVWGPEGTAWGDNNTVSIAMLMGMPLLLALRLSVKSKFLDWALLGSTVLFLVALLGTQSRGGLVGLLAFLAAYVLRSHYKMLATILAGIVLLFGILFMPQSWKNRMDTIINYEGDASATTRIIQWEYAIDIAGERPFFGNGFNAFFHPPYIHRYLVKDTSRSVHSIYFEALGEHGYIGLIMFLTIGTTSIVLSNRMRRYIVKNDKGKDEFAFLGYCTQYSFFGYAANGLTINVATLDIYYYIIAILVLSISQCEQYQIAREQHTPAKYLQDKNSFGQ